MYFALRRIRHAGCWGLAWFALAMMYGQSDAAPIVYEGFDYSSSTLDGQNGGTGWGAVWRRVGTTNSTAVVNPVSLTPPSGNVEAPTGGSALFETPDNVAFRNFGLAAQAELSLDQDQDIYLSVLARRSGSMTIDLGQAGTVKARFGTSTGGSQFIDMIGGQKFNTTPNSIQAGRVYLWVLKISAKATEADQLFVKAFSENVPVVEPSVDGWDIVGEPGTATGTLTRFSLATNGTLELDEIRIGHDWASVTAVPEAGSVASVLGVAGVILARRRHPRRSS